MGVYASINQTDCLVATNYCSNAQPGFLGPPLTRFFAIINTISFALVLDFHDNIFQ